MKTKTIILLGFILIKFILAYVLIHPAYDLHRDEYLHLDQADHLAWGYISVPPVMSWISFVIKLFGNGYFWIKFFPALFGALTIVVVWKIVEELKGGLFALILSALAMLFSVILRINMLYQPNSLDVLFWTLTYFIIIKFINTNNSRWLYALAFSIGFGILSKYNILFLLIGLVPAVLLTEHRKVLLNRNLYYSIGIVLIIVLPNVLWQIRNHFPTYYQLQELDKTQLVNVNRLYFIRDQFLYFLGQILLIVLAFISFFTYPPFRKYRIIFWSYVFTILIFIFFKAKSYYAVGLYPVLVAFGCVYLEQISKVGWKKYFRPAVTLWIAGGAILLIVLAFPFQSPDQVMSHQKLYRSFDLLRWEDGKEHPLPQDFSDMLGWSELASKVDSTYNTLEDKEQTLVFCDNYGQAGAINYYSKFKSIHAVSLNADYIHWIPLEKPIKNVILIQSADDDDPDRKKETPWFEKIARTGEIKNPYAREVGTKIYLLEGAKVDINAIIIDEIKKRERSQ